MRESRGHVGVRRRGRDGQAVVDRSISSEFKGRVAEIRRIAHGLSAGRLVQTVRLRLKWYNS